MDRADRRIRRWPWIVAVLLLGLAAAFRLVLPDGAAARIERRSDCYAPSAQPPVETLADGRKAVRLRVLLWNVEGLPWPIRSGRDARLRQMADWIAARRTAGHGPDIVILHKAFVPAASDVVVAGRFGSIVPGPARDQQRRLPAAPPPPGHPDGARWWKGEAIGKWLDGGLYVATDLPVLAARSEPFAADSCAGYDCLSNKGGLVLRLGIAGAPEPLTLFNTHRNSREPAGVGVARAEASHVVQTRENDALLTAFGAHDGAMIAAGDFNNYRAGDRSGLFAGDPRFRLAAKASGFRARAAAMTDAAAWADAYDLVGYRASSAMKIDPLAVATLFDGENGPRLSDHPAQYVIFRLSWRNDAPAAPIAVPPCSR